MRRAILTGAILSALALPVHAAEFNWWNTSTADNYGIKIKGEIVAGDAQKFSDTFRELLYTNYSVHMTQPVSPAFRVTVHLDSDGGQIGEAFKIGAVIKELKFNTFVADGVTCTSSCALIWLAGAQRYAGSRGYIGFHAIYYSRENHQVSPSGNAIVGAYLASLGFNYDTIAWMTQTPPEQMAWLNADVAKQYVRIRAGPPCEKVGCVADCPYGRT